MKPVRVKTKAPSDATLKLTTMGRIIGDQVQEAACTDMMQRGLEWHKTPRKTRKTKREPHKISHKLPRATSLRNVAQRRRARRAT